MSSCEVISEQQVGFQGSSVEPIPFEWKQRWLKGHEYAFILQNIDAYCSKFGFRKYELKKHPQIIYDHPSSKLCYDADGIIYFIEGSGLASEFGFPRTSHKKVYRWKKMNFTTNLPKQRSEVTYVVASAIKSKQIELKDLPEFRMHAVIPFRDRQRQYKSFGYILCHIREIHDKKYHPKTTLQDCFHHSQADYYRMLAFLHNLQHQHQHQHKTK